MQDNDRSSPKLAVVPTAKGNVLVEITPVVLPPGVDGRQGAPAKSQRRAALRGEAENVGREAADLIAKPIAELGDAVNAITSDIVTRLENLEPSEFTIELKLGLAGEAKIPFVASGKTEGAITVKLTWKEVKQETSDS